MSFPFAANSFALASTVKADSVPSLEILSANFSCVIKFSKS